MRPATVIWPVHQDLVSPDPPGATWQATGSLAGIGVPFPVVAGRQVVVTGRQVTGSDRYVRRRMVLRRRRRRTAAVALLVTIVLVLVAIHPWSGSGPGRTAERTGGTTAPTGRPAPVSPTTVPAADRVTAIGSLTRVYDEPGKELLPPHSPDGTAAAPRQVSVEVLYPATGVAGSPPIPGAPVADGGPFPLVVFGPGFDEATASYDPILEAWASHGFVVAAITFPLTNPAAPGGPYRPDILNQPADMATVVQDLVAESSTPSSPLHGAVNGSEVGVAGQSDGGDTALALSYNTCCRFIEVGATVILSGAELHSYGGFPGTFFPSGAAVPHLLAFQGTADTVENPPAYTDQFFTSAPQPKYLVCLDGADHLEAYTTSDSYEALVAEASIDFLDHYLWHRPGSLAAMTAAVQASPVASLATSCTPT